MSANISSENNEHIGWIPTLSGKLFFDNWDCSSLLKKRFYSKDSINQKDNYRNRRVILSTTVNWKDLKFFHDGNFKVNLISSSKVGEEDVPGRIYIYPNKLVSRLTNAKRQNKNLIQINKHIKGISKLVELKRNIKDPFEAVKKSLDSVVGINQFYVLDFSINIHGFITLSYNFEHSESDSDPRTIDTIIRQGFYFIKYSLHYHQHHSAKDDSFTKIHLKSKNSGTHMIKDLKKGLVNMKRKFDVTGHYCLFDAGGIVSYTKSLAKSCRQKELIEESEYLNEITYLDNISNSFSKKAENEERIANKEAAISSSFRSVIAVFLAIFAPLTVLYKEEIRDLIPDATNNIFIEFIANALSVFYSNAYFYAIFWVLVFGIYMWIVKTARKRGGMSVDRFLLVRVRALIEKPTKAKYFAFFTGSLAVLLSWYLIEITYKIFSISDFSHNIINYIHLLFS